MDLDLARSWRTASGRWGSGTRWATPLSFAMYPRDGPINYPGLNAGSGWLCRKANTRSPGAGRRAGSRFYRAGVISWIFTPERRLDLKVAPQTDSNGSITIRATLSGSGEHNITVRADNLAMELPDQTVSLKTGIAQTIVWRARVVTRDAPWIAVVIPDKDFSQRKELTGALVAQPRNQ